MVASKAARRDPVVEVKAVKGELPDQPMGDHTRRTRYARAMAEVRAKVGAGTWASIATFDTPTGAAGVRRAIYRGERPIDGRLSEWEIEARRTYDDADVAVGSELYVRLKVRKPRAKK